MTYRLAGYVQVPRADPRRRATPIRGMGTRRAAPSRWLGTRRHGGPLSERTDPG
jgi:hypothetical protein